MIIFNERHLKRILQRYFGGEFGLEMDTPAESFRCPTRAISSKLPISVVDTITISDKRLEIGAARSPSKLARMNFQERQVDELLTPVNFNAGWVNTHGVELCLLDARGRLVRKYATVLWNNDRGSTTWGGWWRKASE